MVSRWRRILVMALIVAGVMFSGYFPESVWAQNPALTRDIDSGDRRTRIASSPGVEVQLPDTQANGSGCYGSAVPAGKRWIIEHVSASASMPTGQVPSLAIHRSLLPMHTFSFSFQGGPFSSGRYLWEVSQPIMIRLEPGEIPCFSVERGNGSTGMAEVKVFFSGYEINYP